MGRTTGFIWVFWCALAIGLLVVSGCHEGVTPGTGTVAEAEPGAVEAQPAEAVAEANVPNAEPAVEPGAVEAVGDAEEHQAEAVGGPVELALRFSEGQRAVYKVTVEAEKRIEWVGPAENKPALFQGGRNASRIEITFEQRAENISPDGDALLKITLKALAYVGRMRDDIALEFDSSAEKDQDSPLALLIGQGYRIRMSPKGEVLEVLDVTEARDAVAGPSAAHQTAGKLLAESVIKNRHRVAALASLNAETVRPEQQWSNVKTFDFGMMGAKSYERQYRLAEVVKCKTGRVAVIDMEAIPSAVMAEQIHAQQTTNMFAGMFDNTGSYTGRVELDLDGGWLRTCREGLRTEWIVAQPFAGDGDAGPTALKMGAARSYHLERLD